MRRFLLKGLDNFKLNRDYTVSRIPLIIVADRGLNSKGKLNLIKKPATAMLLQVRLGQ